jgi:hypothetical protein
MLKEKGHRICGTYMKSVAADPMAFGFLNGLCFRLAAYWAVVS